MADHKDEGPAHRQRRPFGYGFADSERCKPNPNPKHAQLDALDRLGLYRTDLDDWDSGGRVGPIPTPDRFGLRLDALPPSEVLWRAK